MLRLPPDPTRGPPSGVAQDVPRDELREIALQFGSLTLTDPPEQVAAACAAVLRTLLERPVRLVLPSSPRPITTGDDEFGMVRVLRFATGTSEGEVWSDADADATTRARAAAAASHIGRVWTVQQERAATFSELERLRFELASMQQVARTLAIVRGVEETEHLVLDSVAEVFFAWWAALYRTDGGDFYRKASRCLRGDRIPEMIPIDATPSLTDGGQVRGAPFPEAVFRSQIPADLAAAVPLDLGENSSGLLLLGPRMSGASYDTHDRGLLRALADSSAIALRNADMVDRLRTQAAVDPLTGCKNRRAFDEMLSLEFVRARRYGRPLSLVVLDLDHFKQINDRYGHEAGDNALRRVGWLLRHTFRVTDGACRYGGEEFALVFPETPKEQGIRLAELLREMIESVVPDEEVPCSMTASIGIASFPEDASEPPELLRAADRALYRAKTQGRNRVAAATAVPNDP